MKVLVLGASGMLGNAVLRVMHKAPQMEAFGAMRSGAGRAHFPDIPDDRLLTGLNAEDPDSLFEVFARVRPDIVVNCVGLIKQDARADDPLVVLPLNALLPHRLSRLCALSGARLVHVSTDCVFRGAKGGYLETDAPDAEDLYGRSKLLGEVSEPHAITLRTSIIGHERGSSRSLIGWFLAQQGSVRGFTRAIFSGLPTVELARVMRDVVLPRPDLSGLYHVAAAPISKHDLLALVAQTYGKDIVIEPDDQVRIDRSLNAGRFEQATGYVAPPWPELVKHMHAFC